MNDTSQPPAPMDFRVETLTRRPDLADALQALNRRSWPAFLYDGDVYSWKPYYAGLSDFILLLVHADGGLMGAGFTVPVAWNGDPDALPETIEQIVEGGLQGPLAGANTLMAVAALVDRQFRAHGLSAEILTQVKRSAIQRGMQHLMIPVRPTWKARYPLQSMEGYAAWRKPDGLPYDPWLRTHERLGAAQVKCVDCTMRIQGTIDEWEQWTGMVFPESGSYVVPHALQPVQFDVTADRGVYEEPNVWMRHPIQTRHQTDLSYGGQSTWSV